MRMWMVNPSYLCNRHLLGEHFECHKFFGHLRKKRRLTNYIAFNLLEPKSLKKRHDALAVEMQRRGMSHKSPLKKNDLFYLPKQHRNYKVDVEKSLKDLIKRCSDCRKNFEARRT